MGVLAAGMRKVDADVRLEWALVRCKAGIAINAKQGTAGGPRIGDEEQTDLFKLRRKAANERQRRFNNGRLVSRFVFREPLTVVVPPLTAAKT